MITNIHGGDVYNNKVNIDFSVNVNPLGVPSNVRHAMTEAIENVSKYPDIRCDSLKEACAKQLGIKKEYLIFGNGSSELYMAIANTLKPQKVIIPVPSFFGYEYAFFNVSEDMIFYLMRAEDDYKLTKEFIKKLNDIDCIILANPNNPTGAPIEKSLLIDILNACSEKNIKVILDECFIEFTDEESMIGLIDKYPNLIIVRSFTKIYAIPSVRLGYSICSDELLNDSIRNHLPEWNVSGIAENAGIECTKCSSYIADTKEYVKKEREYLSEELRKLGIRIFDSAANYIFLYSEKPLYDLLLKQGILIRDCSNYRGLGVGYFRIAVKTHDDNLKLINELKRL